MLSSSSLAMPDDIAFFAMIERSCSEIRLPIGRSYPLWTRNVGAGANFGGNSNPNGKRQVIAHQGRPLRAFGYRLRLLTSGPRRRRHVCSTPESGLMTAPQRVDAMGHQPK